MRRVLRGQVSFGASNYWTLPFFDPQAFNNSSALVLLSIDGGNTSAGKHIIGDWATNQGWKLTREADAAPGDAVLRLTVGRGTGVDAGEDTLDLNIPAAMWGRPIPVFAGRIAGDLAIGTVGNTGIRATPSFAYVPNNGTVSLGYDINNAGAALVAGQTIFGVGFYQSAATPGIDQILMAGDLSVTPSASLWSLNRFFQKSNYTALIASGTYTLSERLTGAAAALGDATLQTAGVQVVSRIMTP